MSTTRVTITLDRQLLEDAQRVSEGNFSRFVARVLRDRLDVLRRERLRSDLQAGYVAEAEADLEIAAAFGRLGVEAEELEKD